MKERRCFVPLHHEKVFQKYSLRLHKDDNIDDGIAHGENSPEDPDGSTVSQLIRLVVKVTQVS